MNNNSIKMQCVKPMVYTHSHTLLPFLEPNIILNLVFGVISVPLKHKKPYSFWRLCTLFQRSTTLISPPCQMLNLPLTISTNGITSYGEGLTINIRRVATCNGQREQNRSTNSSKVETINEEHLTHIHSTE